MFQAMHMRGERDMGKGGAYVRRGGRNGGEEGAGEGEGVKPFIGRWYWRD